ncbi:TetR/AcrR family transcriptional regulator [Paenibacillus albiflavus]|uniref:TetR/AcrR family transcriptional regulator n=1 Tax=Paenibacillus albiflavus TaxID=2545760 RepID=A0A4R4EH15_9BACL|nr:TetR/AcrR family transcriptional regulator [Paenibacillus albiflavus]TCZ78917.1 TetR/AcrR family transcriptional regulator [Paenibacillus albiflavus]
MANTDISLRELKKARTKLTLYEALLSLIGDKMFHELMLEDICRHAEVSRVTFFKFFQRKEDLLIYFMRVWLTERVIEIEVGKKRGFDAVRHILWCVAEQAKRQRGIMPSLISFLAQMNMHPRMPVLSDAEVRMLFPDHEEIGAQEPDMYLMFRQFMMEANTEGRLKEDVTMDLAIQSLFTIFYGAFLTANLYGSTEIETFYENHLQLIEKR